MRQIVHACLVRNRRTIKHIIPKGRDVGFIIKIKCAHALIETLKTIHIVNIRSDITAHESDTDVSAAVVKRKCDRFFEHFVFEGDIHGGILCYPPWVHYDRNARPVESDAVSDHKLCACGSCLPVDHTSVITRYIFADKNVRFCYIDSRISCACYDICLAFKR